MQNSPSAMALMGVGVGSGVTLLLLLVARYSMSGDKRPQVVLAVATALIAVLFAIEVAYHTLGG